MKIKGHTYKTIKLFPQKLKPVEHTEPCSPRITQIITKYKKLFYNSFITPLSFYLSKRKTEQQGDLIQLLGASKLYELPIFSILLQ